MRSSSRQDVADVARNELIGLGVEVASAHDGWDGLVGRVVDETMRTLLIEDPSGREIMVPKRGQRFLFRVGDDRVEVHGADIEFRPEDRTKKFKITR